MLSRCNLIQRHADPVMPLLLAEDAQWQLGALHFLFTPHWSNQKRLATRR
jgi:hypothetical protein